MEGYFVLGKSGKIGFQLPKSWKVLKDALPGPEKTQKSVYEMVDESLRSPVGTPPLKSLVKSSDHVAVIVDDFARPTPKAAMLRSLIDHLRSGGMKNEQIDVVFGVGTHRPLTEAEVAKALGQSLFGRIRYLNHNAWAEDLVPIGKLKSAGEVKINPIVAKADFRISVGSIIPHPMNGFGGGAKLIMPGVANFEAIRNHHNALMIAPGAYIGNLEGNPFYEEICRAGELAQLDFVINAVYNSQEEVKAVVAGDFRKAHEAGAEMSFKEIAIRFDELSDVTIVSTFPLDEGPQIIKPLGPATMVTKPGGTVILVASIKGGRLPDVLLKAFDSAGKIAKGDSKSLVLKCLREGTLIVPNAPMDFNCALDLTLLYLSRVGVTMVSPDNDSDQARRLGFNFATSVDEAVHEVSKHLPNAAVNILPAGGLIVPITEEELSFY